MDFWGSDISKFGSALPAHEQTRKDPRKNGLRSRFTGRLYKKRKTLRVDSKAKKQHQILGIRAISAREISRKLFNSIALSRSGLLSFT